jgi:hypothetical protein
MTIDHAAHVVASYGQGVNLAEGPPRCTRSRFSQPRSDEKD